VAKTWRSSVSIMTISRFRSVDYTRRKSRASRLAVSQPGSP
jgi:hypothetical protein